MPSSYSAGDQGSGDTNLDLGQTICSLVSGQQVFNRYALKAVLGRGGMGIVWHAFDQELEREVALKFLPELIIHDKSVVQDLKRETRRSLELTHANIVRIYDFVQDAQSACISMEFVDGDTLSNLRLEKPHNVFETSELERYVEQLCAALDYAHTRAQIVHRDLKPANLMVNSRGDLKVTDFGISRSLTDSVSMLTGARGTSGTLPYMSPQQLDGERTSHLDDIYSLGAAIYDLLTSKPPFYSGGIDRQIHEKIPPPIALRRDALQIEGGSIPQIWEETIAACLAKDPAHRPQSAGEIAWRLGLVKSYEPPITASAKGGVAVPVVGAHRTKRPRAVLIGAAILMLLLVASAGWWLAIERPRRLEIASLQLREELMRAKQAEAAAAEAIRQKEKANSEATPKVAVTTSVLHELPAAPASPPPTKQPIIVAEKDSNPTTSSPSEQGFTLSLPNLNKELAGSYTYGAGYTSGYFGKSVSFQLKAVQEEGSNRFQGVMNEPYTSFGTPKDRRLWADVRGEILNNGSSSKVRFTKTYRYFTQPSVIYEGDFDPFSGEIKGSWKFSNGGRESGTFRMK